MNRIRTSDELGSVLALEQAVLFKHSTRCGSSARTLTRLERYEQLVGSAPVYVVDVIEDRELAREIAERLQIIHESPQVIVLRGGSPAWHASHGMIRLQEIAEHAGGVVPPAG